MRTSKFRLPGEMSKDKREPVSARIKATSKKTLEKAARENDLSLALLVANVLDDYADWLSDQSSSNKKGS